MSTCKSKKIIVGISGGVDSAVSAYLLKKNGYDICGLFMQNWENDDANNCTVSKDLIDAQIICNKIGIPLHTVNFAKEYWDRVFNYFLAEYKAGRTPNPDVLCNKEIKFNAFLNYAINLGADFIATGHYANIEKDDKNLLLVKAADLTKDQTYFLHLLTQTQLEKTIFPLGKIYKTKVREIAQEAGLINYNKKDSTGICFIGEQNFKNFLSNYLPHKPGEIKTTTGEIIGKHDGLMYYTLGQRQGIGIGGRKNAKESPWYVIDKDLTNNILIVGQGDNNPLLYKQKLQAKDLHFINDAPPQTPFKCSAKIRYRQQDQACVIEKIISGIATVNFLNPQRAITPGQSVVFYTDNICLGGGVIL